VDKFQELYMCSFQPDPRMTELQNRLHDYYKQSDKLGRKAACGLWLEFKDWALYSGYTRDEINKAKRVVTGWHI